MTQRQKTRLILLGIAIVLALVRWGCSARETKQAPPARREPEARTARRTGGEAPSRPGAARTAADEQMLLGNPDGATDDPGNRDHYLLRRPQYALSYNDSWRFPNWVAWRLSAADIGEVERGDFRPDPDLPDGFTVVTPSDYTRSGYDRGHNCNSKDRSASREDNDATFYMSNMTPQKHGMNAGAWENLESYCRQLAREGNECYIVCGHGFDGGRPGKRIGRNDVAVPDFGWKVVLVLPEQAGDDRARIAAPTRVLAVKMPNDDSLGDQPWENYLVTPAEIERATGLTLFDALPAGTAQALRPKKDEGRGGSFATGGGSGYRTGRKRR